MCVCVCVCVCVFSLTISALFFISVIGKFIMFVMNNIKSKTFESSDNSVLSIFVVYRKIYNSFKEYFKE